MGLGTKRIQLPFLPSRAPGSEPIRMDALFIDLFEAHSNRRICQGQGSLQASPGCT